MSQAIGNCLASTWESVGALASAGGQVAGNIGSTVATNAYELASCTLQGVSAGASFVVSLLSSGASAIGSVAAKVGAAAQPIFSASGAFLAANSGTIALGVGCTLLGAAGFATYSQYFTPANAAPADAANVAANAGANVPADAQVPA